MRGADAIVNLAGAGVGDHRWTSAYKSEIRASRVLTTLTLALAAADEGSTIRRIVCGSAIGFYGDTDCQAVDESAPAGELFLSGVVRDWEAAADPARAAGISVAHSRSGLVVSSRGGAWARMIPLFRLGLGGKLGDGRQCWSFISLRDEVAALTHLLEGDLRGPVNLVAPNVASNAEITRAMGEILRRPTALRVPRFALRLALGEFSSEVLTSSRVVPRRLVEDGFHFRDPTIHDALRWALHEEGGQRG